MKRFSDQSRGPESGARARFQAGREQSKRARLQIFAVVAIVLAGAAYFFGTRHLPVDAFVGTLRAGDEEGRVAVRAEGDMGVESLPFSTAGGEVVRLVFAGPPPGRFYWGIEDYEARRELDYNAPLVAEIEQALRDAQARPSWPLEAERIYQMLRARIP